jgi:hypothetical protein
MQPEIHLPVGSNPPALTFPHFSTRQQTLVWRNWELVPINRLAGILRTSEDNVYQLAKDLGLRTPPRVNNRWLERGYVTLIRNNWHLLPYEQLCELLGWSAEKLDFTLREEDFLWIKLGSLKPKCEPIYYSPLTPNQLERTLQIRQLMAKHFPVDEPIKEESAFAFVDTFQLPRSTVPVTPRSSRFDLRLAYPYFAVYGDPLITPAIDPFPDGLLERYAEMGINGVWMQGLLYTLVRWNPAPEMSAGFETRIENLRKMVQRLAKYGIDLYLYLNEPRAMPLSFFEKYPDWKGVEFPELGVATLCTSHPAVPALLRQNTEELFRQVPDLAGVFTITMSENPTHCHSRWTGDKCPRCAARPIAEVVAEVNQAIEQGVHAASPQARVIAYSWGWNKEWAHQVIDLLPENIEVMCVSEEAMPTSVGGVSGSILDYSISQVGPGDHAKAIWQHAQKRGMKTIAKVQLNNSWECSAVPYIPAVDLVQTHLDRLAACGVNGLMVSWTLGGYPGGNLELLEKKSKQLAVEKFGSDAAPIIRQAWALFSKAFQEFPFDCSVIYNAPHNIGPANLLYRQPTGFIATMVGFPYDDLKSWRSIYPEDIFENQFRKLSETWKQGLDQLKLAESLIDKVHRATFDELHRVAWANYYHFRSGYLQIAFIRLRDSSTSDKKTQMLAILDEEIDLAKQLYLLARQDSRIGFEATNHYAYTLNDLKEKVLNCEYLRTHL